MFFRERKDTSKDTIAAAAVHLNKTPKRQGSNQSLEDLVKEKPQEPTKKN